VLKANLQRVVNGSGRIEQEYAASSGRLDLLLIHGDSRIAINPLQNALVTPAALIGINEIPTTRVVHEISE
jgi:hypothetical protein